MVQYAPIPGMGMVCLRVRCEKIQLVVYLCSTLGMHNDIIPSLSNFLDLNTHLARPSESDHMLWLRNFNCHHPIWEGEANEWLFNPDAFIQPFLTLLYSHDMILALPMSYFKIVFSVVTGYFLYFSLWPLSSMDVSCKFWGRSQSMGNMSWEWHKELN